MKSQGPITIAKNSVANLVRFAVSVLAAALLPPFLTRRLSHDMYAAWVPILQLSAYAAIFELGLQLISKFVAHITPHKITKAPAEWSTPRPPAHCKRSACPYRCRHPRLAMPHLFGQLTPPLVHQVRLGIPLVGGATALALPTTALASSFQGVQRYKVPMIIGGGSQLSLPLPSLLRSSPIAA